MLSGCIPRELPAKAEIRKRCRDSTALALQRRRDSRPVMGPSVDFKDGAVKVLEALRQPTHDPLAPSSTVSCREGREGEIVRIQEFLRVDQPV